MYSGTRTDDTRPLEECRLEITTATGITIARTIINPMTARTIRLVRLDLFCLAMMRLMSFMASVGTEGPCGHGAEGVKFVEWRC